MNSARLAPAFILVVCTVVYELHPEVKLLGDTNLLIGVYCSPDTCSSRPPVRQAALTVDEGAQGEQGEG
jgi:hypothetical protein